MTNHPEPGKEKTVHEIDLIRTYRLNHNLSLDHPFWTDERILYLIELGME